MQPSHRGWVRWSRDCSRPQARWYSASRSTRSTPLGRSGCRASAARTHTTRRCCVFLHVDAKALDSGYCEPLRREAWGAAGRSSSSQTGAILHLLSQPVQEEPSTIAVAIETSTLDVERKHNLDRRREAPRVSSVPKASRDALVRHWRAESRAAAPAAAQRKELRAHKFANKVSAALERRPELFPQARGKLHWESTTPARRRRFRSHRPLQRLLGEYAEEHEEELEAETARRHARASQSLAASRVTSWPESKAEWLRWICLLYTSPSPRD